ncbi:MAG: serine/threonine protein kinase [Planctomycetia bacterium]|nr:serine/threonine protein kinase [Planctomycetia bacterium]
MTASATRYVDEPLSSADEERLAELIDVLSDVRGPDAVALLERLVGKHPDLAGQLRELFAAMSMADAVAEASTIFEPTPAHPPALAPPAAPGSFVPGVTPLPASFDDYELLEEVGRGGMGIVYRARQKSLDRVVAVKMLLRRDLATAADLARFRSEAEAAARLDHPGIVSIFEVGECGGHPFYSMRFIEGTTLAKRLASGGVPPREAATILARVAEAVDAAHRGGVLHRDLKPSNILIDAAGKPHVSDFGLAKRIEADQDVTHTGAILGTPCYMSPEQAAGSRGDVGPTSDVWSLGAMLYQTLTGRPPFQAANPMDTLLAVLESDPPVPRSLDPGVNRDLEMIALKSLQKPQDLRYASAADLAADLRAFLAGEPVAARRGGLSDIVARLFRETHHATVLENWGLLWMWHSVVVLTLCVVTDVLAWQGVMSRWPYVVLWGGGLAVWAPIFWALRHRTGPVTAVERQIAHIWGGSVIASVMLFWVEALLALPALTLSPVLALLAGIVFFAKAGILSGVFYIQAALLFATALVMCVAPAWQHVIFGLVSAACFFVPGLKYARQRGRAE